jgi:hypothetical protein
MFLAPNATGTIFVWLFAVLALVAVVTTFFNPAISAAIPDLVPISRIASANSLGQLSFQLSVFVGQGLGGTLFRLLGAPLLFFINGLTYLFSAFSESLIAIPQVVPEKSSAWKEQFLEFKQDTWEGFRYVWNRTGLREVVLVSALLAFFTTPVIILLPFYVEDFLKAEADWYGFMLAAYGIGSLVGYLTAGSIRLSGKARARCMVTFIILQAAGHGLLGVVNDPGTAVVLALLGGLTGGFVTVNITTILQITTPGEIRGRIFGLLGTISGSLTPIAMGLAGVVADLVNQNIPLIYISCGAIMTSLSILVSLRGEFRSFLAYEGVAEVSQEVEGRVIAPSQVTRR